MSQFESFLSFQQLIKSSFEQKKIAVQAAVVICGLFTAIELLAFQGKVSFQTDNVIGLVINGIFWSLSVVNLKNFLILTLVRKD